MPHRSALPHIPQPINDGTQSCLSLCDASSCTVDGNLGTSGSKCNQRSVRGGGSEQCF